MSLDMNASSAVKLTMQAALKVAALVENAGNPKLCLRLYITGGGCSGFQYGFMLDVNQTEDDVETKMFLPEQGKEVKLIVDPLSMQYLAGAEVNFKEDLSGAHFEVHNPSAETTCGCGSSFSIKEAAKES